MKILVTAPAGEIGRRVLSELLAPEFSVRIITRDPGRLAGEIREQVEIVRGATDDPIALRRALDGVDSMFWHIPGASSEGTDVRGRYLRFARAGCQAIREAQTPRVVTVSAVGKGVARDPGLVSALHEREGVLNESGAAFRHLRSGVLGENPHSPERPAFADGNLSRSMSGEVPPSMVEADDLADAALRWLVRRDWEGTARMAVHGRGDHWFSQAVAVMET
ncbi:MAG TPA: NAD(P)H-binding protein [Methylomirabilota bacterium]|nr:NAD(P)H-binding protein [Methylomirabilota bacterium]